MLFPSKYNLLSPLNFRTSSRQSTTNDFEPGISLKLLKLKSNFATISPNSGIYDNLLYANYKLLLYKKISTSIIERLVAEES